MDWRAWTWISCYLTIGLAIGGFACRYFHKKLQSFFMLVPFWPVFLIVLAIIRFYPHSCGTVYPDGKSRFDD